MASQQKRNANQAKETQAKQRPSQPSAQETKFIPQTTHLDMLERAIEDPQGATPNDILALQKTAGNRAVSGLIQTKLRVGPVGDQYEQEADRVADKVMRIPASDTTAPVQRQAMPEEDELLQGKPLASTITPVVQRQEMEEELLQGKSLVQRQEDEELLQGKSLVQRQEDEELLQGKSLVQRQEDEEELVQGKPLVQRQEDEELLQGKSLLQRQEDEEELVQGKSLAQRQELDEDDLGQRKSLVQRQTRDGFQAGNDVEHRLASSRGSGSPLPDHLLSNMEARFGNDFSAVRVHTGGESQQLNRNLSARAFTHGSDIYMGSSQYNPDSTEGQRLLAHELTHVVQQTGHRAKTVRSTATNRPSSTVQMTSIIQRAVTDSTWADLLPKEKKTLIGSGFFSDTGLELEPAGSQVARNWDKLETEEKSAYYQQAQTKLSLTTGATIEINTTKFNDLEEDERKALRALRTQIKNYDSNPKITTEESVRVISMVQGYRKLSEEQKKALVENYGISTATEYASIPRSRVTEVHQLLEDVKNQGPMQQEKDDKAKALTDEEDKKKEELKNLKEKPGFWEMAGEGWRGFGTSIKRGVRSLLGVGMSSNTAKRRIYARRRQQILKDRLERGQMPTRQRSLRARPAPTPKSSGPSSDDLKNIMQAIQAIQGLDGLKDKDTIISTLLTKAGMG